MTFSFFGIATKREYALTLVVVIAAEALVSFFFGSTVPNIISADLLSLNIVTIGTLIAYAVNILAVAAQFTFTARRLRGLGRNPWLALLLIIPLVNLVFAIFLLFGEESRIHPAGENMKGNVDANVIDVELKRQADEIAKAEQVTERATDTQVKKD